MWAVLNWSFCQRKTTRATRTLEHGTKLSEPKTRAKVSPKEALRERTDGSRLAGTPWILRVPVRVGSIGWDGIVIHPIRVAKPHLTNGMARAGFEMQLKNNYKM